MNATLGPRPADPAIAPELRRKLPLLLGRRGPGRGCLLLYVILSAFPGVLSVAPLRAAERTHPASMQLISTAFLAGEPLPANHTCDGNNVSPPLQWSGAPPGPQPVAPPVEH